MQWSLIFQHAGQKSGNVGDFTGIPDAYSAVQQCAMNLSDAVTIDT